MAEVPEVEILVRGLQQAVVGREILAAAVALPAALRFPAPEAFAALVAGRRVAAARRRAKYILCELEGGVLLAMHCMLDGTLQLVEAGRPPEEDLLVAYRLDGGQELRFRDRKGYARAAAGPAEEAAAKLGLGELGPEALEPGFGPETLRAALARRRGRLKSTLTDQRVLAGLGSRDADESLWQAGIDPRRPAGSLGDDELARLSATICAVLEEGLSLGGTMRDLFGNRGRARHRRLVHGRAGEPCQRCGATIQHEWRSGQATYYCPGCQA